MCDQREVKQVIVFRNDLIKGKDAINKGKIASQVAHASLGAILSVMEKTPVYTTSDNSEECILDSHEYRLSFKVGSILDKWINGIFTKVCLGIDDDRSLVSLYRKIKEARPDIPCVLITDCGKTCFNGIPTNTCIGIGPFWADEIDEFTKELKLMR